MKLFFLSAALLCAASLFAQSRLPIIRANSTSVSIRDGANFQANAWTLSPEARPDVYISDRSRKPKWVVFYTDLDSIRTRVKPGTSFDFIILFQGKDSCYTRINSAIPPESTARQKTSDTIPFTLTEENAIHVNAVINDRDSLNLHFDVGSFDFRFTREAILKKTGLLASQSESMAGGKQANFNKMDPVHKIQIGNMIWDNPVVMPTQLTAHGMDGRFGWNLFEGKTVEINYDKNLLIVHSERPKNLKGYKKAKLSFLQSFVCVEGALAVKDKTYKGFFLLDTGSDQAIIVDSLWAVKEGFPKDLPLLKTTVFSDPRGVKYESRTVLCPQLQLNGFTLSNLPATLLGSKNPVRFEVNYLGNDVLKRFNTLLDFKHDLIYLKPNMLTGTAFREAKTK